MEETYEEFVGQILRPTNLSSLKEPFEYDGIRVLVYRNPNIPEPTESIELTELFPFNTIYDLQSLIYVKSGQKDQFHPQNQCILQDYTVGKTKNYFNFLYTFSSEAITLQFPFTQMKQAKPHPKFVDIGGNTISYTYNKRDMLLLEATLFKTTKPIDGFYTLHLFLYNDVNASFTGIRPLSSIDWDGRIRPYFPMLKKEFEDGSIDPIAAEFAPTRAKRIIDKLKLIEHINTEIMSKPLFKPGETSQGDPVNMSNFRSIRITWQKPKGIKVFPIESLFFDFEVTPSIPYIRFFPTGSTPISKICVEGPLNKPVLNDPSILIQWAQDRSLTPEEDLIMMKILIRPASGAITPLYATFLIFQDGSAQMIIQPNTDSRVLGIRSDLSELSSILDSLSKKLPYYTPKTASLADAYSVFGMWLDTSDQPISQKSLMKVLPYFRTFFQITNSPIQQQRPISFLRYKCVSDFRTPSRDFQFLRRVWDLQKLSGLPDAASFVKFYQEEFDVPISVAQKRVADFFDSQENFEVVDPIVRDYTQKENPGIDVAIFGKHPYYTFHIYRVDSILQQRRLKTLLSLLVSSEPSDFEGLLEPSRSVELEEQEEIQNAEEEQEEDTSDKKEPEPLVENSDMANFSEYLGNSFDFQEFVENKPPESKPIKSESIAQLAKVDTPIQEEDAVSEVNSDGASEAGSESEEEAGDISDASQIKQLSSKTYFGKRLAFYDKKLFRYHIGQKAQKVKPYSRMCAANDLKQPIVLNEDEYARMKQIYKKDIESGRLFFLEYPIQKSTIIKGTKDKYISVTYENEEGEKVTFTPNSKTEIITTLRYGSNLMKGQSNIYICSEYWCRYDDIVVLSEDFKAEKDRQGKIKPPNTCPFCKQGLVRSRTTVEKGESVIQRSFKPKTTKRHTFVGFLKKLNPQGYYLPCCFIKDDNYKGKKAIYEDTHYAYKPMKEMDKKKALLASSFKEEEGEENNSENEGESKEKIYTADYKTRLSSIPYPYITSSEKVPLEVTQQGPQIGICPKPVDSFFAQDSFRDLVKLDHNVWKIVADRSGLPSVSGFFRVGVPNTKQVQYDSFFSALAPYLGLNTAGDVKRILQERIQPPLFSALNYGNFLFEFYDPSTSYSISPVELQRFAKLRLRLSTGIGKQKESLVRMVKAYKSFENYLTQETLKEYRVFAQLLSLPKIISWVDPEGIPHNNGIFFIVLEVSNKEVNVRCPPYGVSPSMAETCDVAFILYYKDYKVWEPVFYSHNNPKEAEFSYSFVFPREDYENWPPIVLKRYTEFIEKCKSSGLGLYTDSPRIQSNTLIPLSVAVNFNSKIYAILRDSYNHVSALLYSPFDDGKLVYLPVIDDGTVYEGLQIELDWMNFVKQLAPADKVKEFYESLKTLPISPVVLESYEIDTLIRLDQTIPENSNIYAIQLANGLFVPVSKPEKEIAPLVLESEFREGHELPWSIDSKLVYGKLDKGKELTMDYAMFEEIYQHLRLTFSNWLATSDSSLRDELNEILFKDGVSNPDLPLFEKRQRLFIKFGNEIESWLDSSIPVKDRKQSIKRIDCKIQSEEFCSNRCVWKADSEACLLHVPQWAEQNPKSMLIKKLIDELIRFPDKREEILKKQVSQYQKLRTAIKTEDQYIIPENSPIWTEFLRMEWRIDKREVPRHYEEFASVSDLTTESMPPVSELSVPDVFTSYFGDSLHYIPVDENDINIALTMIGIDDLLPLYEQDFPTDSDIIPDKKNAIILAKAIQMSIFQLAYEENNAVPPVPLIVKAIIKPPNQLPYVIFLRSTDGRLGLVSSTPNYFTPVDFKDFPKEAKDLIKKTAFTIVSNK
jgi:hypothetical protein